jgi:hypothetical protein
MKQRFRTSWAVALFIGLGLLVALILLVRDLSDDDEDAPEETGTVSQLAA